MANTTASKIRDFMTRNPKVKPLAVAEKFNVKPTYVYVLRSLMKKKLQVAKAAEAVSALHDPAPGVNIDLAHAGEQKKEPDMVNNPPHYTNGGVETISFIEAKGLDYHLGNVVKYVTRSGKKGNEIEDLKKARWYLERAISVRENTTA